MNTLANSSALLPVLVTAGFALFSTGLAAQKGGGGNKGGGKLQDISAALMVTPPSSTASGKLQSDGQNNHVYSNEESGLLCLVGRRRSIHLEFRNTTTRTLRIQLGAELDPMPGDGNDSSTRPKLDFFANNNVPDPSANGGVITDVTLGIGNRENVSLLGAEANVGSTNYCDAFWNPIPDAQVDPNDPATFSRMCTNMRMDFKSGKHKWRIFFGQPNRFANGNAHPAHPDTGGIRVERILPSRNPLDKTVPWIIEVEPWKTSDANHPRYGMVVGYLYYCGTKRQDPHVYAGAFDVRWADRNAKWSVVAL